MALLGQVFQPLGLPHKTDRPLVPEGDNGPEFSVLYDAKRPAAEA